eukprot:1863207-Rhodomonas_salina.1
MVEVERTLTSVGASGFQGHVVKETKEQPSMSVFNSEIEAAAAAAMLAWWCSAVVGPPCWVAFRSWILISVSMSRFASCRLLPFMHSPLWQ